MSSIAIYMEGGGDGRDTKAALRQGMDAFLDALKHAARARAWRWKLVCCGGRQETFKAFRNACNAADAALVFLLVDAEQVVTASPREHLHRRDGWDFAGIPEGAVHLMTQTMEAWIIADPGALERYYGRGFNPTPLPRSANLESAEKRDVMVALQRATQASRKGAYHKIRHASDLLRLIAPALVQQKCPACRRLFDTVGRRLAEA